MFYKGTCLVKSVDGRLMDDRIIVIFQANCALDAWAYFDHWLTCGLTGDYHRDTAKVEVCSSEDLGLC